MNIWSNIFCLFVLLGLLKMKASCLCLTEGKALLVAMKYIKNKRCQRCLVKLHWLIIAQQSFVQGFILQSLHSWKKLGECQWCLIWNLFMQANVFRPYQPRQTHSHLCQRVQSLGDYSCCSHLPNTRWFWGNFCSGRASKQSFTSLTQLVGVLSNNLLMVWENIKFRDQSH